MTASCRSPSWGCLCAARSRLGPPTSPISSPPPCCSARTPALAVRGAVSRRWPRPGWWSCPCPAGRARWLRPWRRARGSRLPPASCSATGSVPGIVGGSPAHPFLQAGRAVRPTGYPWRAACLPAPRTWCGSSSRRSTVVCPGAPHLALPIWPPLPA